MKGEKRRSNKGKVNGEGKVMGVVRTSAKEVSGDFAALPFRQKERNADDGLAVGDGALEDQVLDVIEAERLDLHNFIGIRHGLAGR